MKATMGLIGLAIMNQTLALNMLDCLETSPKVQATISMYFRYPPDHSFVIAPCMV